MNGVLGLYGPSALIGIFIISVFTGALIPRWLHNQQLKDKDRLIEKLTSALDKRDEQFDTVFKSLELTVKLLEDFKAQAQGTRPRQ